MGKEGNNTQRTEERNDDGKTNIESISGLHRDKL
jgi:hypothetical protein